MRRINKFKNFNRLDIPMRKLPNKFSTFYRSKWQNLKFNIGQVGNIRKFVNPLVIKLPLFSVQRVSKNLQLSLGAKKSLSSLFDNVRLEKFNALSKQKKDLVNQHLVLPLYRVDILLWYLNIFPSVYNARQHINNGDLKINNKTIKSNFKLKKGDIIWFNSSLSGAYDINYFSSLYLDNTLFLTFVEVDFYMKTVTIVKGPEEISSNDYNLLIDQYINVYKINH